MAGIYDRIAGIKKKICKWWSYYFCWSWSALFVSGLYFGHAFVEYSFLGFLVILVGEKTGNSNLRHNAIISNAQDVFHLALASVLLSAIEVRIRPFYMILITYGSFFLGTLILWITPTLSIEMIYFALVPLTVGEAGEGFIRLFLARRLQLEKKEQDEERIEARVLMCRFIARFLGAAIANLWISKLDWKPTFMSSAIVTGTVYLLFGFGFMYYYKRLNQSSSTEREDSKRSLLNRISRLSSGRFIISKTQHRRESNSRPIDHESHNNGKKELWLFLRKLPLWFPFLFYYVVDAAGSTFFMEQTDKLNDKIGENYHVPSPQSSFLVVQKCTKFIASNLADYLIKKFCKDDNQERRAGLVRMSLGMCACSGCCIVAWLLENHRLDLINENPDRNPIPMSILLLAPQFSLLGFANGLIEDGMEEFFRDYAPASIHHFAMAFTKAVDAGGKLIAVVFILTLKPWIGKDVNTSHLDSYYRMLAILVLCALQFFIILANIYDWEIEKKEGDDELDKVETGPDPLNEETGPDTLHEETGPDPLDKVETGPDPLNEETGPGPLNEETGPDTLNEETGPDILDREETEPEENSSN
ncbi:hypothetical protein SLA2020_297290 [Shorea laevis]